MAKVNIRPLADRVLVEPLEAETKTASGIIIPDSAKEKPQQGVVVAVGAGKKDEPMTVKEGDKVIYGKYSGSEFAVGGYGVEASPEVAFREGEDSPFLNGGEPIGRFRRAFAHNHCTVVGHIAHTCESARVRDGVFERRVVDIDQHASAGGDAALDVSGCFGNHPFTVVRHIGYNDT